MKKILILIMSLIIFSSFIGCQNNSKIITMKINDINPIVLNSDYNSMNIVLTPNDLGVNETTTAALLSDNYKYMIIRVKGDSIRFLYLLLQNEDNIPDYKLNIIDTIFTSEKLSTKDLLNRFGD